MTVTLNGDSWTVLSLYIMPTVKSLKAPIKTENDTAKPLKKTKKADALKDHMPTTAATENLLKKIETGVLPKQAIMKMDVGMKTNKTKENNQPLKISYFQHYED